MDTILLILNVLGIAMVIAGGLMKVLSARSETKWDKLS